MYSALSPERAGCNGKLPLSDVLAFQKVLFGGRSVQYDYSILEMSNDIQLVTSIDKVGRFCEDLSFFATSSICHAFRDLHAGGATKGFKADICFEFGNDLPSDALRTELVRQVGGSCHELNVTIGKCHSVLSAITGLTIAAYGLRKKAALESECSGTVWLTSRLGAFRSVYLSEQGHIMPSLEGAKNQMTFDYADCAELVSRTACDAADVSGFGLGGALCSIAARNSYSVNISLPRVALVEQGIEPIACLQSDLPPNLTVESEELRFILAQREVSGPLVIFSNRNDELSVELNKLRLDAMEIGTFEMGNGMVSAQWS